MSKLLSLAFTNRRGMGLNVKLGGAAWLQVELLNTGSTYT